MTLIHSISKVITRTLKEFGKSAKVDDLKTTIFDQWEEEIGEEGGKAASQINQSFRGADHEGTQEGIIDALARWVDDHEVGVANRIQPIAGGARENRRASLLRLRAGRKTEGEPGQTFGTSLVEADAARAAEEAQAYGADPTVGFG